MVELCFLSAGVYGSWRMTGRSRRSQGQIGAGSPKIRTQPDRSYPKRWFGNRYNSDKCDLDHGREKTWR